MQTTATVELPSSPSPVATRVPIKESIKTAWSKVYGAKKVLFLAFVIITCTDLGIRLLDRGIGYAFSGLSITHPLIVLISVIVIFLSLILFYIVLLTGGLYLGIRRAADLPINLAMMFQVFHQAKKILALVLLMAIIIGIAMLPLFIPEIVGSWLNVDILNNTATAMPISPLAKLLTAISYIIGFVLVVFISIRLSMALPLVLDCHLNPIKAIKLSFHGTRKNFWRLLLINLIYLICATISLLTIGIAGIWLAPFFYILYGVVYKTLFGIAQQV